MASYHRLLFTFPHVLNRWIEVHDREIYSLLFETVWVERDVVTPHSGKPTR